MTPFEEPVSRTDQALLRHLVLEHKSSERRRRFPAVLHLGSAGGPVVGRVDESAASLDDALRSELLSALWRRARQRLSAPHKAMAWLTRPGTLEVQDVDLAWLRAVGALDDGEGRSLPFVVITRTGWRDPRSGATRTWVRCRRQR